MIIQIAVVHKKRHAHWQVPPEYVTTRHQALVTRSLTHYHNGSSAQEAMNLEVLAERAVQERLAMERGTRPTCYVCGDRASGRHYGVLTCDGCRGFFKRSVRRNPGYSCKFQGTCIVDLKRRNQCQACRFQRCLNVGMNRHAVQHERLSKNKTGSEASRPYLEETHLHNICSNIGRMGGEEKCDPTITYGSQNLQEIKNEVTKENRPPLAPRKSLYSIDSLLEVTSRERSKVATVKPLTPPLTPPQSPLIPSLYREKVKASLETILQGSLSWARSMPIFRDLSNQDKCILLREGWTELFLLTLVEMEFSDALLISFLRETTEPHIMKDEESKIERLAMALARLSSLNIDPVEMAYLKAVAIFKPYIEGLATKQYVESMQDQAQVMLADYVRSRYPGDNVRFGRLILTLTLLKSLGLTSLENCLKAQLILDA